MGKIRILSLLLICLAVNTSEALKFQSPEGFIFEWTIEDGFIIAKMTAPAVAWVGFGWHCQGCDSDIQMANVDFVIGLFNNNGTFLSASDRASKPGTTTGQPVLDTAIGGVENVVGLSGTQTASQTSVTWQRALNTSDTIADHVISTDAPTRILYAWGQSNSFGPHGPNAFQATLNFGDGSTQAGSKSLGYLRYWHGALMFFAYGVFMPLGIFVARYLKHFDWWFPVHWGLMTLALCMVIAALILIILALASSGSKLADPHEILGMITVLFTALAPVLGVIAHCMWNPNRDAPPLFPDQLHWWAGRLTVLLGWANIVLGLATSSAPTAFSWVAGGCFIVFLVTILFIEVYRIIYPRAHSLSEEEAYLLGKVNIDST